MASKTKARSGNFGGRKKHAHEIIALKGSAPCSRSFYAGVGGGVGKKRWRR